MKLKTWAIIIIFLTVLLQTTNTQAQKIEKSYTIDWVENIIYHPEPEKEVEMLFFHGASQNSEFPLLPLFFERISVDAFFQNYDVVVRNLKTTPLSSHEISLIPTDFSPSQFEVKVISTIDRKKNFAAISFTPIFKQNETFVKVNSFDISINGKDPLFPTKRSHANHSVLGNGSWYKIAVSKTGIYKVTYDDLVALGVPVSGLSSSRIALFGNGGRMLPEKNSISRADDLIENPIMIYDGGDGSFDSGDFFIFYAQGPHQWNYSSTVDESNRAFSHTYNIYTDYAYYFINTDAGIGEKKRITTKDNHSLTATNTVSTYTHYDFFEIDEINLMKSGKDWYGDKFDITTSRTYTFNVPGIVAQRGRFSMSVAFASSITSRMTATVAGQSFILEGTDTGNIANKINRDFSFTPSTSSMTIQLDYNKPTSSAVAYLDWLEIQVTCNLSMHSAQFPFCNLESIGPEKITQFNISNSDSKTIVWDVTDPTHAFRLAGTLNNSTFSFKSKTDSMRQFVAFNGEHFYSVTPIGSIGNQNLHGTSNVDMVIITYPDFVSQAERLAEYRRENDGLSVKVTTPQQVYNEFSSGAIDPIAIRDYMKMIYDKSSGAKGQYLLLFGRPSYDYRGRVNEEKLYVPNYQYSSLNNESALRANDDYFGSLDDHEGDPSTNGVDILDVAIGRFPVTTAAQAKIVVDKTINYSEKRELVTNPNSGEISNLGDWRNVITLLADDEESAHVNTSESSANIIAHQNPTINIEKIYCDAYSQVSYSGGQRYPEVNIAINNRMERGALVFSYYGHGGGNGWAHERILEISDINKWRNLYNQPIMTTLTCEFGWYDRAEISPAELVFINNKGGAAGMITTSRTAFMTFNDLYSITMYTHFFEEGKRLGDINRIAKNASGGMTNGLNMIVTFGDPTMPIAFPKYEITTDSINGKSISAVLDTISALSKVTIKGRVTNENGTTLSDFNGSITPTIFDKPVKMKTLQNDPSSRLFEFMQQKNVLFKGNASVKNGYFEFSFIMPKDINFSYGNGKISYYAKSNEVDAAGYSDRIIIGGMSDENYNDSIGPQITIFFNDETFVNGGITDQNPTLIVHLADELGINTTGNGIGHDLIAILDNAAEAPITLNDYYEAKQDSYNSGTVRYPLKELAIGKHTLKIRAWDIMNNVSEKSIDFEVISNEKLTLAHVLNYPNPFTTHTDFFFEHNQPGETFDILVQIFTISGKLVTTLTSTQVLQGNRCEGISWNGRDQYGDKLGKGVYLYRMKVRNQQGDIAEKIEKLVIL